MNKCKPVMTKNEPKSERPKKFIIHYYDGNKRAKRIVYI